MDKYQCSWYRLNSLFDWINNRNCGTIKQWLNVQDYDMLDRNNTTLFCKRRRTLKYRKNQLKRMKNPIPFILLIIMLSVCLSCEVYLSPFETVTDEISAKKDSDGVEVEIEPHDFEETSTENISISDSGQPKEEHCLTDVHVPLIPPPLHVESEKSEIKANGKDSTTITMYIRSFIECKGKRSLPGLEAYISTSKGILLDKMTRKPLSGYVKSKRAFKVIFDSEGYSAILQSDKDVGTAIITVKIDSKGIEESIQLGVKFTTP